METSFYKVRIQTTEDTLGTVPKNKLTYAAFIASKAADLGLAEEEVATVQNLEEKGWTGFHTDEDGPFLYNYAMKGYLCEAARTLKQYGNLKQLQDKFKRYCFVHPRRIRLPNIEFGVLERPLRGMTAQGPRVTLARSDVLPKGTILEFQIEVLDVGGITEGCLREVLSYGRLMGLGQWRSGGFGSFSVLELEEV